MRRLDELFGPDTRSRWRILAISALTIAVTGALSELENRTVRDAQILATMLGVVAFLVQVGAYCLHESTAQVVRASKRRLEPMMAIPRRLIAAAVTVAIVAVLDAFTARKSVAAILDKTLRMSLREPTLSPKDAERVADCLRSAARGPLSLPPQTLTRVRDAVKASALQDPNSPAVANASNALVEYGRERDAESFLDIRTRVPRTEAEAAFKEGVEIAVRPLTEYPKALDQTQISAAVSAFTRALALAGNNTALQIECRLLRGAIYGMLGKYDDALADAEAAERLGALDLSRIIPLEAKALVSRGRPGDLQRGVELLTFAIQSDLSSVRRVRRDPRDKLIFDVQLLASRSLAYYKLGEFNKAIEDCVRALNLTPPRAAFVPTFFHILIFSYLHRGEMSEALRAASALEQKTGDPRARMIRAILESNQSDPEKALTELQDKWPFDVSPMFTLKN